MLRHKDFGEADRLLTVFTRENGKLRAVAKGVRKIRSRKAGHLQPFSHVTVQLAVGRDLWVVVQASLQEDFQSIRDNLEKTAWAAYVVELVDRFSTENGENRGIFQLLLNTLRRLEKSENHYVLIRYYEIRLLDLLGYRPNLKTCVRCSREISAEDQYFSFIDGGVVCPACKLPGDQSVKMETLKYFRHFQRSTYKDIANLQVSEETAVSLEKLIQDYLVFLLERKLNAPVFLSQVRKKKN